MSERFFLSQDKDSHWYLIPEDKREDWYTWCDLDTDDDASWDVPSYAEAINGPPSVVTFSSPVVR